MSEGAISVCILVPPSEPHPKPSLKTPDNIPSIQAEPCKTSKTYKALQTLGPCSVTVSARTGFATTPGGRCFLRPRGFLVLGVFGVWGL